MIDSLQITAVAVSLVFIFGIIIGSFLNVLIWRLPREEKPGGRSRCPHCSHDLVWYDLVPLFSFLSTRGRCRYCKKTISFRYPVVELVTGLLFGLAAWILPITDLASSLILLKALFIIAVCIVVFAIDLEHYLILDKLIFPAIGALAALLIFTDILTGTTVHTVYGVAAALIAFIPFWLMWYLSKGKWMGYGDVKFMVFMGLALGLPGILVALFLSFVVGAILGLVLIALGSKQLSSKLPFGTFLTVATVAALLYGQQLWQLYWSMFSF